VPFASSPTVGVSGCWSAHADWAADNIGVTNRSNSAGGGSELSTSAHPTAFASAVVRNWVVSPSPSSAAQAVYRRNSQPCRTETADGHGFVFDTRCWPQSSLIPVQLTIGGRVWRLPQPLAKGFGGRNAPEALRWLSIGQQALVHQTSAYRAARST
jgi:hypothetical protein